MAAAYIAWFEDLTNKDVPKVGGKNASLGEMIRTLKGKGVVVPGGFATTAEAYRHFLKANGLSDRMREEIRALESGGKPLHAVGEAIRRLIRGGEMPEDLAAQIREAYRELSRRFDADETDVAVRSSATAEDLPDASFAGQQETFLNVRGERDVLDAVRNCFASLFTDRAISYRTQKGFDHLGIALSAGVQKMVRSDKAGAGVMFSIDTETGFPDVVVVTAAWGLGENVVQGAVTPDEYRVFKPLLGRKGCRPLIEKALGLKERRMVYSTGGTKRTKNVETSRKDRDSFVLSDEEVLQLAQWAKSIEEHYGWPMDMEWAKDGETGRLFIVQARPETVQSAKRGSTLKSYELKERGERLAQGLAIGEAVVAAKVQKLRGAEEIGKFRDGSILVTEMTDPDWVPIMKKAAGIVTEHGGRTSHAAIVSRELGIPAIVGALHALELLKDGQEVTMSCAEGDTGYVYKGRLAYEVADIDLSDLPRTRTQIMMNIAEPAAAFRWWRLPCAGIGLARMEFIINNAIKCHPLALIDYDKLADEEVKRRIDEVTRGYRDKAEFFTQQLSRGIAKIAASQYPDPVIVRMSDFKTNEYAELIGGQAYEPQEANPMLGFRGASRYYSGAYRPGFALECEAVRRVREEMGLDNVVVMIPFCRTLGEADKVLETMVEYGLRRGENGLQVYVMAEIPSNVILAEQFAERFDGFSIGSNDLTQLTLGVDRDSAQLASLFDEQDEAVTTMIEMLIQKAHKKKSKVGICGQAPSDHPEFAAFLVRAGIDSISLNPDSVIKVIRKVAEVEREMGRMRKTA